MGSLGEAARAARTAKASACLAVAGHCVLGITS